MWVLASHLLTPAYLAPSDGQAAEQSPGPTWTGEEVPAPSSLRLSPQEIEPLVQGWACQVMGHASAAGLGPHCLPCTLALCLLC